MDPRFSERSREVMTRAREEAVRLFHEYLGTEHVLLGILGEENGPAAEVLGEFGVTLEEARKAVEARIGLGPERASPEARWMTPRGQRVVEMAFEEMVRRGQPKAEPEHLLIGIAREIEGVGAQILRDLQTSPEAVRERVEAAPERGGLETI